MLQQSLQDSLSDKKIQFFPLLLKKDFLFRHSLDLNLEALKEAAFDIKTTGLKSKQKFSLLKEGILLFGEGDIYNKHMHLDPRKTKTMWVRKST